MSQDTLPAVAVVIPAYNHEATVTRTIESVASQEAGRIEVVVIDDGSSDNTYAAASSVAQRLSGADITITVESQQNRGISATLNRGISMTTAPYISVIASDDYFLAGKLKAQLAAFASASSKVAVVHTSVFLESEAGERWRAGGGGTKPAVGACFHDLLTRKCGVWAPTAMFSRTAFESVGGFDENLVAEDYDFYMRIAANDFEFLYLSEPLVVKTVTSKGLGEEYDLWSDGAFVSLDKHKGSISEAHYHEARAELALHLATCGAMSGKRDFSREMFDIYAQHAGRKAMLQRRFLIEARAALLGVMPFRVRNLLREIRRATGGTG